jgi:hypothetical protein
MGHLSARDSMKGASREGSFTGDPKDMLSKARKQAPASVGVPIWGTWMGASFFGPSYSRNFYEIFERFAKCPVDEYLSP